MQEILKTASVKPDESVIGRAASILQAGGVIAYPTETFYGLGADSQNEEAIRKIFLIKGRNFRNPLSIIIGNGEEVKGLVEEIPTSALDLMEQFWPGALIIVFRARGETSGLLTAGTGKIGIRLSCHPVATALAKMLGHPITATSANPSGGQESTTATQVAEELGNRIDAIVDGGITPGGVGSTIIDVTTDPPIILREGTITKHELNVRRRTQ